MNAVKANGNQGYLKYDNMSINANKNAFKEKSLNKQNAT